MTSICFIFMFLLTNVFYMYYICNLDYLDYCLYPVTNFPFDKLKKKQNK
jgi:hypothetical protein